MILHQKYAYVTLSTRENRKNKENVCQVMSLTGTKIKKGNLDRNYEDECGLFIPVINQFQQENSYIWLF